MRLYLLSAFLFCLQIGMAQDPSKAELAPCGTAGGISPFLKAYHSNPNAFLSERSSDTLKVGMQLHLLAKDNGIGRIGTERLLDAICQLNADFGPSGIQFYSKYDWNEIDSTGWYQHDTISEGRDMMLANNVPDVLNIYFASNVAGNCGYNLPYGGVAIAHGCSGANDHTWAHEVGHALSLPHPFLGWEGKVYSPSTPTPLTVTYDYTNFHDTIDIANTPLDTAFTELVDGSNCAEASDLICDTPPDYLSYRWECNAGNLSNVVQTDPTGASFRSDGTLYMSYAFDGCQNHFSDEQISIMRSTLEIEKPEWLTTDPPAPTLQGPVTLLFPVGGQNIPPTGSLLQWASTPGATHYLVQVSVLQSYIVKVIDMVVTDTMVALPVLNPNKKHYWRVRPFNNWSACVPFTANGIFNTTDIVETTEPDVEGWRCYPSLLSANQPLTIEWPDTWLQKPVQCMLYDAAGRAIWQNRIMPTEVKTTINLPSVNWASGVYRLVVVGDKGLKSQPLLLTK